MLILLDCRPLQLAGSDSEKNRLIVSAVATFSGDTAVEWLFLVDHTYRPGMLPELPGSRLLTDLPRAHLLKARGLPGPLGWKLWYDWQLPRLIKRYKPDLVMLTGGVTAKSSPVPQYLWMPANANPKEMTRKPVYAARLGASVRQAEMIFCFSEKDRAWLAVQGHIDAGNILVVRPFPSPAIHPLPIKDKEAIKQRYTQGKEYFFTGAAGVGEQDVVQLLKAFSLFKKRQLSNLQLVIAGVLTTAMRQRLATYKYHGDVHWVDGDTDDVMAAAYAVLLPFEDDLLGAALLNAWKAGTPAVVAAKSRMQEMADDAALVAGIEDPATLAGAMMSVYKDETLRDALIEKGKARLTVFDPPSSLAAIRAVVGHLAADRPVGPT